MTFELVIVAIKTGKVVYAISNVRMLRYVTEAEVGFIYDNGRAGSVPFLEAEYLELRRPV